MLSHTRDDVLKKSEDSEKDCRRVEGGTVSTFDSGRNHGIIDS